MDTIPHPDTPPKRKQAVDGYQTRAVAGLPGVPAMSSQQVTETRSAGATDIRQSPVGDVVFDDAD